ncbi:MAG: hypothetical protein WBR18_11010 [Anaerolineales bacterium]
MAQRKSSRFTSLITIATVAGIIVAAVSPATGPIELAIIIALLVFQRRIGELRAAALLVTLGSVSLLEHLGFSVIFALGLDNVIPEANQLILTHHANSTSSWQRSAL